MIAFFSLSVLQPSTGFGLLSEVLVQSLGAVITVRSSSAYVLGRTVCSFAQYGASVRLCAPRPQYALISAVH